jgi:hypothetical protein
LGVGRPKRPGCRCRWSLRRGSIRSARQEPAPERADAEYSGNGEHYSGNDEQLRSPRQSASKR